MPRLPMFCALLIVTVGCVEPTPTPPPPAPDPAPSEAPARAVIELYMHTDGATRCVDSSVKPWKAIRCCPDEFSFIGYSVRAATSFETKDGDIDRQLYRHVVCLEDQ